MSSFLFVASLLGLFIVVLIALLCRWLDNETLTFHNNKRELQRLTATPVRNMSEVAEYPDKVATLTETVNRQELLWRWYPRVRLLGMVVAVVSLLSGFVALVLLLGDAFP